MLLFQKFVNTKTILTLLVLFVAIGQIAGKNSLGSRVFLSCESQNLDSELKQGYRAFILSEPHSIKQDLGTLNMFLEKNPEEIICLIFDKNSSTLASAIEHHSIFKYVVLPTSHSVENYAEAQKEGKRVFIFTPERTTVSFSGTNYLCAFNPSSNFPADINQGFKGDPANDLVLFDLDKNLSALPDSLKENLAVLPQLFNEYTGKLPNFIVTDSVNVFTQYYSRFSRQKWYSANVEFNGETLSGINWVELPRLKSYGKIYTTRMELSPKKAGFRFSPDVFTFNNHTSGKTKIFYATQLKLTDELAFLLNFEQNINNEVRPETQTAFSQVSYVKDPERNWCVEFNGQDDYIDFDTDINFENSFTVSAWVKPTKLNNDRSIIGKGKALSIKIRDASMLFTSPGIKDHLSDSAVVSLNQWQLLSYVISAGETVRFYKNGQLVGEDEAAPVMPTNHSLLIGTNLWDESFEGRMDELAIWNRALSPEEVLSLYTQGVNVESKSGKNIFAIIALFLILVTLVFLIRKRTFKRGKNKRGTVGEQFESTAKHTPNGPSIELFGGFKLFCRQNQDLTKYFSPKRKQIFILVLIETIKSNGISSKQLTNKLWAGYSAESAKNNRSTQMQRIREILKKNSGIGIHYENKLWRINFDDDVYCDLAHFFGLLEEIKSMKEMEFNYSTLNSFLHIVENGAILPNMDDEWLDSFKSEIADDLLETLVPLFQHQAVVQQNELVLRMSSALLIFDPLNELLLKYKMNSLIKLGKTTQAHETLDHFVKIYQQCYNQSYSKSFTDLIEQEV